MMIISREDYDHLMKLQVTPTTPPPLAQVLPYLPVRPTLGSLTWGHLPICKVHNPYLLVYPNYHNLPLFLLRMVMSVLLWVMARPIGPPHSSYIKSFMFTIFLSTFYLLAPSPKHYFGPSHSFLTIAPFMICRRGRGLVWGMRLNLDFMSLSPIIFHLGSLVSFPRSILHSSGINDLATQVSPNFAKLSHGFLCPPLSVSHVN